MVMYTNGKKMVEVKFKFIEFIFILFRRTQVISIYMFVQNVSNNKH